MKSYKLNGDHGFDNRIVSMRAIFVAIGPDFAEKTEINDFENIELYNLFACRFYPESFDFLSFQDL